MLCLAQKGLFQGLKLKFKRISLNFCLNFLNFFEFWLNFTLRNLAKILNSMWARLSLSKIQAKIVFLIFAF